MEKFIYKSIGLKLSLITFLVFTLLSAGNVRAADPSEAEVRSIANRVLERYSKYFAVKDINFKNFEGQEAGTGRTSIAGTAILFTDLYDTRSAGWIKQRLLSEGIPERDASLVLEGLPHRDFYAIESYANTTAPFQFELNYTQTVSGFNFSIIKASSPKAKGRPIGNIEQEHRDPDKIIILGTQKSEDYYALALQNYVAREQLLSNLNAFFAGSTLTGFRKINDARRSDNGVLTPVFDASCPNMPLIPHQPKSARRNSDNFYIDCSIVFKEDIHPEAGNLVGLPTEMRLYVSIQEPFSTEPRTSVSYNGFRQGYGGFSANWTGRRFSVKSGNVEYSLIRKSDSNLQAIYLGDSGLARIMAGPLVRGKPEKTILNHGAWRVYTIDTKNCSAWNVAFGVTSDQILWERDNTKGTVAFRSKSLTAEVTLHSLAIGEKLGSFTCT